MSKTTKPTNMEHPDKESFQSLIIAIVILVGIWIMVVFTILKCTAIIILVVKLVKISNSKSTTNDNGINTSSSSHICMKCLSKNEKQHNT